MSYLTAASVNVTHIVSLVHSAQSDGLRSHNSPENPAAHLHLNEAIPSSHDPPFCLYF